MWTRRAVAHPRWTHGNKKSTFVDGRHQDSGYLPFTANSWTRLSDFTFTFTFHSQQQPILPVSELLWTGASLRGLGGQSRPARPSALPSVPSSSLAGSPDDLLQSCCSSPLHSPQDFSDSSAPSFLEDGSGFSFSRILGYWIWSLNMLPSSHPSLDFLSPIFPPSSTQIFFCPEPTLYLGPTLSVEGGQR